MKPTPTFAHLLTAALASPYGIVVKVTVGNREQLRFRLLNCQRKRPELSLVSYKKPAAYPDELWLIRIRPRSTDDA